LCFSLASHPTPLPYSRHYQLIVASPTMARVQAVMKLLASLALGGLAGGTESESALLRGAEQDSAEKEPPPSQAPLPAQRGLRGRAGAVTTADVEKSLLSELAGNVSKHRLQELEEALRPMYAALPKERSGYLGHQAVRYALHRLLLQRHGWFVVGLEPTDEALPPYLNGEWVPQYLQGLLEQRLGDEGINLREIAALAATLEDLVRAESARRVDTVYQLLRVPAADRVGSQGAERVLETYMMMYLNEGNLTAEGKDLDMELLAFKQEYTDWDSAASWMQQVKDAHLSSSRDGKLGRAEMVSIANELGERFGAFNDGECKSLKRELLGLEGPRPGRVPLVDFYQKGLYSHWQFNEKVDYLRVLGALDESDELHPSIILPNYLGSRPNCLTASGLYAVCCRNECEDLMGTLERQIAAPTAPPQLIQALVAKLHSDTTNASRVLPESLVQRLQEIAVRHGGQVPLHGRLFAQWMHHAYPRECPYPHEGGVNPQTPDEWMQEAGEEKEQQEARASKDEVRKILGDCATAGTDGTRCSEGKAAKEHRADLPWSDAEVLLASRPSQAGSTSRWSLVAKGFVLVALLAVARLHSAGAAPKTGPEDRVIFEDELQKPGRGAKPWMLLLALVIGGGLLECLGVLDRFSFGCTMAGGLLLNFVLPLMMQRNARAGLKLGKSI